MKTIAFLFALSAAANPPSADCLGPVCLRHTATVLSSRFKLPPLTRSQLSWSLAARNKSAFALLAIDDEYPERFVSYVLLSSELLTAPSSLPTTKLRPSLQWRTSRGIGLGDTRAEVIRAYGPPTSVVTPSTYPWAGREGVESLDYSGCDSLQTSTTFFIRNDHVVGIAVWASDC